MKSLEYSWRQTDKFECEVIAVIVTFRRIESFSRVLQAVNNQSISVSKVIVIDNNIDIEISRICTLKGAYYIKGHPNLGGAGGYARGLLIASMFSPAYVWTLDDDGYPEKNCLERLRDMAELFGAEINCPLTLNEADPSQTANPYIYRFRKISDPSFFKTKSVWSGLGQFFNGVLFSKLAIDKLGVPNEKLFIRGDEIDYFWRAKAQNLRIFLSSSAIYYHPTSNLDFYQTRPGSFWGAVFPVEELKRWYQFRNRGYLIREHKKFHLLFYDLLRYSLLFFFIRKLDIAGFIEWLKIYTQGMLKKLDRITTNDD